jgi:hypothetical protein
MCMLTYVINHVHVAHMHPDVLTFKGKIIHFKGKKKIIKCNLWINIFYQIWDLILLNLYE